MAVGDLNTSKTWNETLADLQDEFRKWGVDEFILPTKRACEGARGVTIRYVLGGEWRELTCDKWQPGYHMWLERNIRALYLAIQSVRLMDQRGLGAVLAAAAAPLMLTAGADDPLVVLGLMPGASYPAGELRRAYRAAARKTHPDVQGGSLEAFQRVQAAAEALGIKE